MELKKYQRKVLSALREYAHLTVELGTGGAAYDRLLAQDGLRPGKDDIRPYVDDVNGAPRVCVKVPTGAARPTLPPTPCVYSRMSSELIQGLLYGWCLVRRYYARHCGSCAIRRIRCVWL